MTRALACICLLVTLCAGPLAWSAERADRITPLQRDDSILSTKSDDTPEEQPKQPDMPEGVSDFQKVTPAQEGQKPALPTALPFKPAGGEAASNAATSGPMKMPFGRGEAASMPNIPSAPHKTEAVPVVGVDAVEASEPAPASPVAPEADPTQEDPADPTDLTAPIFGADANSLAPRKIILRALNKVTAQSALLSMKPGEKILFGQLEITGVGCQVSQETSQTDYAALLDIAERQPSKPPLKPIFKGWMYASSPSITGLEHPIYDIALVECKLQTPAAREEKPEKSDKKAEKKAEKKAKH